MLALKSEEKYLKYREIITIKNEFVNKEFYNKEILNKK